jgi:hypothetical protein
MEGHIAQVHGAMRNLPIATLYSMPTSHDYSGENSKEEEQDNADVFAMG